MFQLTLVLIFMIAFQSSGSVSVMGLRTNLESRYQCQDLNVFFWSEIHQLILDQNLPKSWEDFKQSFSGSKEIRIQKLSKVIQVLQNHLTDSFFQLSIDEQLEIWSQLELGVDVRFGFSKILSDLNKPLRDIQNENLKNCLVPYQAPAGRAEFSNLSVGARKLMSTAYQSCEAPRLAALDAQSSPLEGVAIIGDHADKIGKVRKISNLPLVQKTHPYLRIQNKEMGCFPVMEKPLIYDYGGKPSYPSANGFEINLFKNAGSGGIELGIDCSAFVVASLGVEGLRLKPNEDMTARNTAAFGTTTLIRLPDSFPCFDYVPIGLNQTILQPGDVVTVTGHTLIIDEVGKDPLGLSNVNSENGCQQLTTDRFDFRVLHSSPGAGSTGISRMQARDYLKASAKMSSGFLKYAKNHCLLKLKNQMQKPKYVDVSIVRHKKTSPCLGRALTLTNQACVKSCL